MTTTELNQYLLANIRCNTQDFRNGLCNDFSHQDSYLAQRNDAGIYCWSGMQAVVRQVTTSPDYCTFIRNCAEQMCQNESQSENEQNILVRAIQCVKNDGDDLCDEQSVGWYLAVYIYMHCLAYNSTNFETLFLQCWHLYFTEDFQQQIRLILDV